MKVKSDAVRTILHRNLECRSMNQGKLEVIKEEMARMNIDILGISELKWTGMGESLTKSYAKKRKKPHLHLYLKE